MKNTSLIALILCLFISSIINAQTSINTPVNEAGLNLYLQMVKDNPSSNVFISPYSISNAMAMCYVGAKLETKNQMAHTLAFDTSTSANNAYFQKNNEQLHIKDSLNTLNLSNALWYEKQYEIESSYSKQLSNYFKTEAFPVSFKTASARRKSAKAINKWIAQNSNQHIKEIIDVKSLDETSKLVITNAIYFKGIWKHPFEKSETRKNIFTNLELEKQEVDFMNTKIDVLFLAEEEIKILELPYAENRFSFIILLPQAKSSLNDLEERLSITYLDQLLKNQGIKKVSIAIPTFDAKFSTDLKDCYSKLGMKNPFSNQANFSGINKNNELKIDEVYHKAFFSISEEGSEAAAASAAVIGTKSAMLNPNSFIANKPFLYLIKDNSSGTLLFIGRKVSF